jgi:putative hydrolase of the HAD superfamily
MLDWQEVDTVFLDMDGTLLALHFDNHFWLEHVPLRFAEKNDLSIEAAKKTLLPLYRDIEGTLNWYCIDHWSNALDLDIALLKGEIDHLISIHPFVPEFLDALRDSGRRAVIVTNAHRKSLALKMEKTRLEGHFDQIVCAHDLGLPKEDRQFWPTLQKIEPFKVERTLLVDDSHAVLESARDYDIAHLLSIHKPDTRSEAKVPGEFRVLVSFGDLLPID